MPSSCPAVAAATASTERVPRRKSSPSCEPRYGDRLGRRRSSIRACIGKAGFRLESLRPAVDGKHGVVQPAVQSQPGARGRIGGVEVVQGEGVESEGGVDGWADRGVAQGDPPAVQQRDAPDPQHRQVGRRPGARGRTRFLRARLGRGRGPRRRGVSRVTDTSNRPSVSSLTAYSSPEMAANPPSETSSTDALSGNGWCSVAASDLSARSRRARHAGRSPSDVRSASATSSFSPVSARRSAASPGRRGGRWPCIDRRPMRPCSPSPSVPASR